MEFKNKETYNFVRNNYLGPDPNLFNLNYHPLSMIKLYIQLLIDKDTKIPASNNGSKEENSNVNNYTQVNTIKNIDNDSIDNDNTDNNDDNNDDNDNNDNYSDDTNNE